MVKMTNYYGAKERHPKDVERITELKAEVAALKKAIQDEVEALGYVDHAGVRHITHPTTRALAALLEGKQE